MSDATAGSRPFPRGVVCALLCLMLAGCTSLSIAPRPSPPPAPTPADERPEGAESRAGETPSPPPRPRSNTSSASQSLLTQSRAERSAGSYTQATASLERALRIDPNNAVLWVELGEIQLETGNTEQAEMMARKALTLAGSERAVESQAERLLRAASSR